MSGSQAPYDQLWPGPGALRDTELLGMGKAEPGNVEKHIKTAEAWTNPKSVVAFSQVRRAAVQGWLPSHFSQPVGKIRVSSQIPNPSFRIGADSSRKAALEQVFPRLRGIIWDHPSLAFKGTAK